MAFRRGITCVLCFLALLCLTHDSLLVSGAVRCVGEERESLLWFKQGIIDYYGFLTYWWRSEDCCDWAGVVCSNTTDHVVALHLPNLALQGQLNPTLLGLHYLTDLDLSGNYFYGRVPEFIGSMNQLKFLNLRNSYFYGEIPPQLGNLTNLVSLDLSSNKYLWSDNLDWLSGLSLLSRLNLTDSNLNATSWLQPILKLPSLQELSLRDCGLGDVVLSPALFVNSSLPSLTILDLSYNKLTSSAFHWLFNMSTSLVTLILSKNALHGTIPDRFGRFVSLEYLDLWDNDLEGEIPKSLGNLSHLQIISLGSNLLEGTLEGLFGNVSCSLEIVALNFNGLTGPIPDMAACSSLQYLIVANNNLTGRVPESIGELAQLVILDVSFNSLQGTISEANFRSLHELKALDLSFNSFILHMSPDWNPPFQSSQYISLARCQIGPSFPKWIETQSKLIAVDLSSNGIANEIPKWFWTFSHSIYMLNLSFNQISGTLPDLSKTTINILDVSSNNISGPLPLLPPNVSSLQLSDNKFSGLISSICSFPLLNLGLLDLSYNLLIGELPTCLERLINLGYLNLAQNNFSGEIPHHLGSLHSLRTLHLRDNNLSGDIPSSLSTCKRMQLIDVGGNMLTGNISWIGSSNYTYLNYLILARNRFHGSIPPGICDFTRIRILDLSRNNFSGQIPDCFNNFASMGENTTFIPFVGVFSYLSYKILIPLSYFPRYNVENTFVQWKGQEAEYRRTLGYLKLIDLSSNEFIGRIPRSLSTLKGLISLNLSRNSFTGDIIPDVGRMTNLECLDLSCNHLSGHIPNSLAELTFLSVLDLSNNNLYGKIPSSTQLQSFTASAYAGNLGLCGIPLITPCVVDGSSSINHHHHSHISLSFMQEVFISMTSGFIIGFWGIVGSLVLNKLWRRAYFSFWDNIGRWVYVNTAILLNKFRRW